MRPQESGKRGGLATRVNHLSLCPLCGSLVKSQFYSEVGQKGGNATLAKYGRDFYRKCGALGGRGNAKEKREGLSSS